MRITKYKALNSSQTQLVKDACEARGVDVEIDDRGSWIRVKMRGEVDAIAAAWATVVAGRNEHE